MMFVILFILAHKSFYIRSWWSSFCSDRNMTCQQFVKWRMIIA